MQTWLRHPMFHPLNERAAWSAVLSELNPMWSLTEVRARVLRVVPETPTVSSVWLQPNAQFKGFLPGQHLLAGVELDGVRHQRAFSFSSAPRADGCFRLTIQRQPAGRVSAALQQLVPGSCIYLSQAMGDFSPRSPTQPLLLIAAGSGITPMLSLLDAMAQNHSTRDIVVLHCIRNQAQAIGAAELVLRAGQLPGLRCLQHLSSVDGRLDPQALHRLIPDWQTRETLLCGPPGFARGIERQFEAAGLQAQLQIEYFGSAPSVIDATAPTHVVSLSQSEQVFTVASGQSLLEAAEFSGLTPRFGCRRGICKTCQCRKRSGIVKNLQTGAVSGDGDEWISLCVSTALSPLEISA